MREFDRTMETILDGSLPLDDVVRDVNPWRHAMGRILAGFALTMVTVQFWNLHYILPTIGLLLTMLGFRALRRENVFFRVCYGLAALRFALTAVQGVLYATIYWQELFALPLFSFLFDGLYAAALFALLFCFMDGIYAVENKAGQRRHSRSPAALLGWYVVLAALALVQYINWLSFFAMVAASACILYCLYRLSMALDETGYVIQAAPVRLTDRALATVLLGALLCGVACGYLFCSSYPMDWTPVQETEPSPEVRETKAELLELGFPEEVLNDLTDEDILSCKGAQYVFSQIEGYCMDGRLIPTNYVHYDNGDCTFCDAHMTYVVVAMSDDPYRFRIFHHFRWINDPGFCGTGTLLLYPAYRPSYGYWEQTGTISGQLFCEMDGVAYTAPYRSIDTEIYDSGSFFDLPSTTEVDVLASFSLPRHSSRQRCYLSYSIYGFNDDPNRSFTDYCMFIHQYHLWGQYPAYSAKAYAISRRNMSLGNNIFYQVTSSAQLSLRASGRFVPSSYS